MEKLIQEKTHETISGGSEMRIGVIGLGNMGSAMTRGLIASGIVDQSHLFVSNRSKGDTLEKLDRFGISEESVTVADTNQEVLQSCDITILALKQAQLENLLKSVKAFNLKEGSLIVSVAAGVETTTMKKWMGLPDQAVARAMPNTPIQSGRGFTGWFISEDARVRKENEFRHVMDALGKNMQVMKEEQLHLVTAISGSGPAYFYRFTEAMVDFAMSRGMSEDQAKEIVYETFIGSAIHADKEKEDVSVLRKKITSPRGTTERAIEMFETVQLTGGNGIDFLVASALHSAEERSKEIAREFAQK